MTGVVSPLHVGRIGNANVRFFRDPSGRPGLPWHVADELFRACDLPRAVRRHLIQTAQKAFGDALHTIPTADGVARWCRDHDEGRLSDKERRFVDDMAARLVLRGKPSSKQADWLRAIYANLRNGDAR